MDCFLENTFKYKHCLGASRHNPWRDVVLRSLRVTKLWDVSSQTLITWKAMAGHPVQLKYHLENIKHHVTYLQHHACWITPSLSHSLHFINVKVPWRTVLLSFPLQKKETCWYYQSHFWLTPFTPCLLFTFSPSGMWTSLVMYTEIAYPFTFSSRLISTKKHHPPSIIIFLLT